MKSLKTTFCLVLISLIFLMIGNDTVSAQKLKSGPQDLSFFSKVDETDQPYAVYIPENFDESRTYPLVVFLHGAWSNHRLGLRRVFGKGNIQGTDFIKPGNVPVETDLEATRYWPELKPVDYIVAAPYARGTAGYQGIPEQDVYETITPRFNFIEYPGIGHNSWEYAYKDGFIFEWFSQFTRNLFPQEVKFSTRWFKYNKAYWVKFDNLTQGTLTTIDAKFTGTNTIEVTTNGLEAFTLSLEGHSMFTPGKKGTVKIDSKSFNFKTSDAVSFMKENGTWVNKKFSPGLTAKQQGAEGPLSAAVSSNHVYVYGTGGNPSQEELAARRAAIASLADWTGMGGRIMVFPRVISDKEVRQSDYETSNLILFGTKETNAIIEKFADRLPVHLNDDANDYGLVYIFPLNQHYIIVNSGLPWWTPPKQEGGPGGIAFMGSKAEALNQFQDFILFKETPDNVVAGGTFDNNWKLPTDAAAAMKGTGVIEIK